MKTGLKFTSLFAGAFMLAASGNPADASLLVYEGFNGYSLTSMNSQVANLNTIGLTGSYVTTIAGWGNSTEQSATYNSTGLSFGPQFISTGGSMVITARNTGRDFRASVALSSAATSAFTPGSTLYSSFLFKLSTASSFTGSTIQERMITAVTDSSGRLAVTPDGAAGAIPAASYGSSATNSSFTLSAGTTYLFVSRFTNVGGTGGGTETVWLFDQTSYDGWLDHGAGESDLDGYALTSIVSTGATQADFSGFVQFRVSTGNPSSGESPTHTGVFDELRYGTSLYDSLALTIPEPLSLSILAAGGIALALAKRRTV